MGSDLLNFFSIFSCSQVRFEPVIRDITTVLLDETDMAESGSDPLSTSQIKDWRSILTLIVFILTSEFWLCCIMSMRMNETFTDLPSLLKQI